MNQVILIGNLAADPESRTTQSGIAQCSFRLAVQRKYKNASGGHDADFITVVAWRQLAELCAKFLGKGRKVAVIGSMQTRSYDAQDGTKRYVTEVVAEQVEFLSAGTGVSETGKSVSETGSGVSEKPQQMGFTDVEDDDKLPF